LKQKVEAKDARPSKEKQKDEFKKEMPTKLEKKKRP
jgi:hypothetical protein